LPRYTEFNTSERGPYGVGESADVTPTVGKVVCVQQHALRDVH